MSEEDAKQVLPMLRVSNGRLTKKFVSIAEKVVKTLSKDNVTLSLKEKEKLIQIMAALDLEPTAIDLQDHFIHYIWVQGKYTENTEFKTAITRRANPQTGAIDGW